MSQAGDPLGTTLTRKPLPPGTLKISASSPVTTIPSNPTQTHFLSIRKCRALFIATTKPRPSLPPLFEMMWLTIPTTSPDMLNMGPPEFPVLIVAVV